eukprot:1880871-Rhodomonas_salina.1
MRHWGPHIEAIQQEPAAHKLGDLLLSQASTEFDLGGEPTIASFQENYTLGADRNTVYTSRHSALGWLKDFDSGLLRRFSKQEFQ